MDPDIESKQQLHRRIHFYVIEDVEMELKRLKELDIIETVRAQTGLTPWVSPTVIALRSYGKRVYE